jgi:hypothetical protein
MRSLRTQQGERVRRIGVLMNLAAEDPVSIARAKAFAQGLKALGWIEMCENSERAFPDGDRLLPAPRIPSRRDRSL